MNYQEFQATKVYFSWLFYRLCRKLFFVFIRQYFFSTQLLRSSYESILSQEKQKNSMLDYVKFYPDFCLRVKDALHYNCSQGCSTRGFFLKGGNIECVLCTQFEIAYANQSHAQNTLCECKDVTQTYKFSQDMIIEFWNPQRLFRTTMFTPNA